MYMYYLGLKWFRAFHFELVLAEGESEASTPGIFGLDQCKYVFIPFIKLK